MGHNTTTSVFLVTLVAAILCAACGQVVPPLASPLTPQVGPTLTPATRGTPALTPTITLTPTPGPSPTPNTQETSASVIGTITALAATPTYPPTSTPRPRRTPIGAGPNVRNVPPTALFTSGGISIQTISEQVFSGGSAALTIKTKPAALCTLQEVRVVNGVQQTLPIPGVAPGTTGHDGIAAWIWSVDPQEPAGIMTLVVDCGVAGKTQLHMTVTK